jgi:hypothetical protein
MNLLFDFISIILPPDIDRILAVPFRGKEKEVITELISQRSNKELGKQEMLQKLQLTSSHFDKICSVLLDKCYEALEPAGGIALIENLGRRLPSIEKHFYKEVSKQMVHEGNNNEYLLILIEIFQKTLPIKSKDYAVIEQVMKRMLHNATEEELPSLKISLAAKQLYFDIEKDFATQKVKHTRAKHEESMQKVCGYYNEASDQAKTEILRTKSYLHLALLEPEKCIAPTLEAIEIFKRSTFLHSDINLMRMQLRLTEAYYFTSQFRKALDMMREIYSQNTAIPDRGYYNTKYIQLCLIEGRIEEAQQILAQQLSGYANGEHYAIRDVITTIKVKLFSGEYDNAHQLISLGYEIMVKGKYIQYEVELRNLEAAYFFLTGERDFVVQLCKRNIKFLRQNNFTVKTSRYPEFFMLLQAIIRSPKFTARQQQMFDGWQNEAYAFYGRLLELIHSKR